MNQHYATMYILFYAALWCERSRANKHIEGHEEMLVRVTNCKLKCTL